MQRTALVTGGNRGIGLEIVKGLALSGCDVLLGCRDLTLGSKAKWALGLDNVYPVRLDLGDADTLASQMSEIAKNHGNIDILVNNAAILNSDSMQSISLADLKQSFETNFFAAAELMRILIPSMEQRGYGRIVNLTSGWGAFNENLEGPIAYATSKAAVNALTLNVANQVSDAVKINSMCPGWVHTRMGGKDAPRTPAQGAETAIWLATLESDGPTGQFFRDKTAINW